MTDLDLLTVQVVANAIGVDADQALLDYGHPHGAVHDLELMLTRPCWNMVTPTEL